MLSLFAEIAKKVMPSSSSPSPSPPVQVSRIDAVSPAASAAAASRAREQQAEVALLRSRLALCATPPVGDFLHSLPAEERDAHLRSLRNTHVQVCAKVIADLMHHKANHGLFNAPVDAVALGIPDYCNYIERPMDLGTIRTQLESDLCAAANLLLLLPRCYCWCCCVCLPGFGECPCRFLSSRVGAAAMVSRVRRRAIDWVV
jgi:hypothetical protein